jgi:hypothetical protein
MHRTQWTRALALLLAVAVPLGAQGKGKGKEQAGGGGGRGNQQKQAVQSNRGQGKGKESSPAKSIKGGGTQKNQIDAGGNLKGRGSDKSDERKGVEQVSGGDVRSSSSLPPGLAKNRFVKDLALHEVRPTVRTFVVSPRPERKLLGTAVHYAFARGVPDDALMLVPVGDRVVVRNKTGNVLLDLDGDRARRMGSWHVTTLEDRLSNDAPSFCRTGAGHPVFGRQWCLNKGFGLGTDRDFVWGWRTQPNDIVFSEITTGSIAYDVLPRVLGAAIVDRLALHALTLGLVEPLAGRWMGEPNSGPRVLLLTSGGRPVAEIVDLNRDGRADDLFVALRPW